MCLLSSPCTLGVLLHLSPTLDLRYSSSSLPHATYVERVQGHFHHRALMLLLLCGGIAGLVFLTTWLFSTSAFSFSFYDESTHIFFLIDYVCFSFIAVSVSSFLAFSDRWESANVANRNDSGELWMLSEQLLSSGNPTYNSVLKLRRLSDLIDA